MLGCNLIDGTSASTAPSAPSPSLRALSSTGGLGNAAKDLHNMMLNAHRHDMFLDVCTDRGRINGPPFMQTVPPFLPGIQNCLYTHLLKT